MTGNTRMMGFGEGAGVVRKETIPDAQTALASTTDCHVTSVGRHLDFESSDLCWLLVG